jgi:hypothetical protein
VEKGQAWDEQRRWGEFLRVQKGEEVRVKRKAPNRSQYARTCWKDVKRL